MKAMPLDEWIKRYEKKTGDTFKTHPSFSLLYLPDRGFSTMKLDEEGRMVVVHHVCGDGQFWRDLAEIIAKSLNFEYIGSICTRRIHAYCKAFKFEIMEQEINEKEESRFLCKDKWGRLVIFTHKHFDEDGEPVYWVTEYLSKEAPLSMAELAKEDFFKGGD